MRRKRVPYNTILKRCMGRCSHPPGTCTATSIVEAPEKPAESPPEAPALGHPETANRAVRASGAV